MHVKFLQTEMQRFDLSPRSRLSYKQVIVSLLRYARRKGYLPWEYREWERLEKIEIKDDPAAKKLTLKGFAYGDKIAKAS